MHAVTALGHQLLLCLGVLLFQQQVKRAGAKAAGLPLSMLCCKASLMRALVGQQTASLVLHIISYTLERDAAQCV